MLGWHLERAYRLLAELGPVDARGRQVAAAAAAQLAAAGHVATGRGDLPAAANLLERAIALLEPGDRTGLQLLTDLGEVLILNVETERAQRVLDEALAAAERIGDRGLAAHATLGKLELRLDSPDRGPDRYRADVQQALSLLEGLGDEQGQSRAWRLLGLDSYLRCQIGRAEDEFQRAVEHARAAGDQRIEAGNLYALVQAAFWGPTPVAEGIRRCQEIRGRAEGSYRVEMSALHTLAGLHAMAGEFDRARELGDAAVQIAGKLGPSRFAALCSQFLGQVELLAGDPAAAVRWLRWGAGILERMGERGLRSELTANLARALAAQGLDDEALEQAALSGELAVRDDLYAQVERRGPLATVLARRGRLDEAERLAAEAVELAADSDMLGMQAGALLDLARVRRLAGRNGDAAALARQALDLAERKGHRVAAAQARELLGLTGSRGDGSSGRRRARRCRGPLRRDVRLLGRLLGQVLEEAGGPELLADVERLRRATIALRAADGARRRPGPGWSSWSPASTWTGPSCWPGPSPSTSSSSTWPRSSTGSGPCASAASRAGRCGSRSRPPSPRSGRRPATTAWPACSTGWRWRRCSPPTRPRPGAGRWSTPCAGWPSSWPAWTPPGCPATTRRRPPAGCWRRSPACGAPPSSAATGRARWTRSARSWPCSTPPCSGWCRPPTGRWSRRWPGRRAGPGRRRSAPTSAGGAGSAATATATPASPPRPPGRPWPSRPTTSCAAWRR